MKYKYDNSCTLHNKSMSGHKLTDAQSSQIKEVIRENLKALHDFCEEHNLTYYLSDGTLLGAIRY